MGYDRNEANRMAADAVSRGFKYDTKYFAVRVEMGNPEAVQQCCAAIEKIVEVANRMVPIWLTRINEAMTQIIEKAKEIQRQRENAAFPVFEE